MMKTLCSLLLFFFFGLLQSTVVPVNFLLLLVILFAVNNAPREGFFWAFTAGILKDLLTGSMFGLTSLYYLAVVFLLILYGKKFKLTNILYILPFTFLSLIMSYVLFRQPISVVSLLISVAVFPLMLPIARAFFIAFEKDSGQLQLMEQL